MFLELNQWKQVVSECLRLERVIIQLVDGEEYTWEAAHIEKRLRHLRPGMIFRVETGELCWTLSLLETVRMSDDYLFREGKGFADYSLVS